MNELEFDDLDKILLGQNGKIIHQVWFGTIPNKKKAEKEYKKLKKYRDSWKIKNPSWYHIEWNKSMSTSLIKKYYPEHLKMYNKYTYEIQRCDTVRYAILHRYGGLYADMDFYCIKPFDHALKEYTNDFYLVQTPNMPGDYVSNSLMYSKYPNHKFWNTLLVYMEMHKNTPIYYSKHLTIMLASGPGILNRVYQEFKIPLKLKSLPHKYFQPHNHADDILSLNNDNLYTIHASKGCWHGTDSTFIVLIARNWAILLFIITVIIGFNFIGGMFL
jgi:mannosyltransferase OCH1-like enzyme